MKQQVFDSLCISSVSASGQRSAKKSCFGICVVFFLFFLPENDFLKILMTHLTSGGGYSLIWVQVDDVLFSIF